MEKGSYINGNEISIPLMRFQVSINMFIINNKLKFLLKIKNSENETFTLTLNSLEETFAFIQNVIKKSNNKEEIIDQYKKKFLDNRLMQEDNNSSIYLTQDEVDQAIIEYFSSRKNYRISVKEKLTIDNGEPSIAFYIIEPDGKMTRLTKGDLNNALEESISIYNYELIDFEYMGGINHVGYHFDENTPYYDGIRLIVKEKKKDNSLTLRKKEENE